MSSGNSSWVHAVELAERELALVHAGEWDLVAELSDERARHTASLPQATEAVRPVLERLAALEATLVETLQAARTATVRELGELRRGRGAMRGYGVLGGSSAGGWVDHAA
jgi:Flagellar protein FliT